MDVLSEVLKVVRLQGALFYNAELSAPWSIRAASSCALARHLVPDAEHLIIYHFLTEGRAFLRLESGERIALNAGGSGDDPARRPPYCRKRLSNIHCG